MMRSASKIAVGVWLLLGGCSADSVTPGGQLNAVQAAGGGSQTFGSGGVPVTATGGTLGLVGGTGGVIVDPNIPTTTGGVAPVVTGGVAPVVTGGVTPVVTGGVTPVGGTGGVLPATTGGAGGGMPAPAGATDPTVPAVSGDCPNWASGTITFMGLGGITVAAGPKAAGPTAPMVFYWHGTGSTSGEYQSMATAVAQGVMSEGGILISFQGSTGGDLLSGTSVFGAGDFELTDQLLACAVRDYNIDPRRVYATGCSAGGLFSAAMAAERSSYIAAAAPNSGGWTTPVPFQTDYTPALMTVHGAPGVDVVVVDFSTTSATADDAFKARGGFVINCNHGGSHCGGGGLAPQVWEFFKAHTYGVNPEPWTSLPGDFPSYCAIY